MHTFTHVFPSLHLCAVYLLTVLQLANMFSAVMYTMIHEHNKNSEIDNLQLNISNPPPIV